MVNFVLSQIGIILGILGLVDLFVHWDSESRWHVIIVAAICCYLIVRGLEYWDGSKDI